jgi:small subunit ribosomal protein S18
LTESNQNEERTQERPQRRRPRRRFTRRPRICQFCADKTLVIEYKNIDLMKRYVTEDGKIRPRRETGSCAKHQRKVAQAVKRARHMALLPFKASRFR